MTSSRLLRTPTLHKFVLVLSTVVLLVSANVVTAQTGTVTPTPLPTSTPTPTPTPTATPTPTPTPTPCAEGRQDRLAGAWWFVLIVSAMFAGLVIPFGWTIMRSIRFSKFTFNSPLGLPEGSLRAMLAFILLTFLGFYVFASILSLTEIKPPDFLLGIVATVIGFYFGSRSMETMANSQTRNGRVQGTVVDRNNSPAVGATVELSQVGKRLTQTTDQNGAFKFDDVPVGNYDIQATLTGQNPSAPAKVTVTAGSTQTSNLKLQ